MTNYVHDVKDSNVVCSKKEKEKTVYISLSKYMESFSLNQGVLSYRLRISQTSVCSVSLMV